ncbi:MAG: Histone H1-like protein HC1 [Candidatus Anoxychlamydiales bacterium]|nr:Histone H1-like protein HC1 [Candidatus Anoxychlamydiales bacterium]NGX36136.1 Histone H1-like protein HC1 [Candidatus Anoxychlamydiales bacterium]
MGLKETIKSMHSTLEQISKDLKKSERGNKAASQRVRTGSIKLAKVAKKYRKESVAEERKCDKKAKKGSKKRKTTKKPARKTTRRKKRR